ncbi:MAG: hypothetical protein DRN15_03075 [Thermoprotei archaeon]|nr:MAG: hypothetical protein DRN15_03075 [Thermoprotei archaeon]RLF25047.1 MAG: hypothetical protein DRM97_02470 [Thermoprotei archaeon]
MDELTLTIKVKIKDHERCRKLVKYLEDAIVSSDLLKIGIHEDKNFINIVIRGKGNDISMKIADVVDVVMEIISSFVKARKS